MIQLEEEASRTTDKERKKLSSEYLHYVFSNYTSVGLKQDFGDGEAPARKAFISEKKTRQGNKRD